MSNNTATEALLKKRDELISEKEAMIVQFNNQVNEIETAIERIEGKKVWETENLTVYDDTNQNYIRSSQEEL